jgi:uncharacterized OB-fold protein
VNTGTLAEIDLASPRAIVPYLIIPEGGNPYLSGFRCQKCGEIYLETPRQCPRCLAAEFVSIRLAETGKLYSFTIVHRSFPEVEVPFVSAIVDLDGGGTIKGNLKRVEPLPSAIHFDMPIRIVFEKADRVDSEGNTYLSYHFIPAAQDVAT